MRPMRASLRSALAGLALTTAVVFSAAAEPFAAAEALITSQEDLVDPEFNQSRGQIVWTDRRGQIWIAGVDPVTGLFQPANGKGLRVATGALTTRDLGKIGNGPEWVSAAGSDRIAYTTYLPGRPHTLQNARIAVTSKAEDGSWQTVVLGDQPRYRPYTSLDDGDPAPRVTYVDPDGNAYWREIDDPATETRVPGMLAPRVMAQRFVEGQRATIFVSRIGQDNQVVRYGLDTGITEQLSFDGGHETRSSPFMWRAPEFGGDDVFVATRRGATEIRVYRQLDKTRPEWLPIHRILMPSGTQAMSVEPFVFDGKSYLSMAALVAPNRYTSAIFIASIDPREPLLRQVTPELPLRSRGDPEVFETVLGP